MFFLSKVKSNQFTQFPTVEDPSLQIKYLGTAGFVFQTQSRTIVVDPFVTRPSLRKTVFGRLQPNLSLIQKLIPKADDVLIGHSHHDHILDAPALCKLTGARLIGSQATCHVGRAAGLPASQMVCVHGRTEVPCGHVKALALPSVHGRVYFNRVSLAGDITSPPSWPPRFFHLRHGEVFNWWLDTGSHKIMHIDSADFINSNLQGLQADIVCLCAIGRYWRPNYVKDVVRLLRPKMIIPCHWDWFFDEYGTANRLLPGVDLPGFINEIRAEQVEVGLLPIGGHFSL